MSIYYNGQKITGNPVQVDSTLSPTSQNPIQNRAVYDALYNQHIVTIVTALPQEGRTNTVYGIIQDEMTREGYPIIQLFVWDAEEEYYYSIAAYSIDIDPEELVYEDNIPYATPSKVGGIKSSWNAATGTWTVITEEI